MVRRDNPVQILSIQLHSYSILDQSTCGEVGGTVAGDARPAPPLALVVLAPRYFARRPLGGPGRAATRAAFPLTVAATVLDHTSTAAHMRPPLKLRWEELSILP